MSHSRSDLRLMVIRQGFTPAMNRALMRQLHEIDFHQVTSYANVEAALEALPQEQPEVILFYLGQQAAASRLRQICEAAYLILSTTDEEAKHTLIDPVGPTGFVRLPCPNWELRARIEAMAFRNQHERVLVDSDERFRQAFEQAGMGIVYLTPAGNILSANRCFCQMVGYTQDELLHLSIDALTLPEDVPLGQESRNRLLAGDIDNYSLEKRYRCKNGAALWVEVIVSATRHSQDQEQHLFSIIKDISLRKQSEADLQQQLAERARAEAALMESEGRFRNIIEQTPLGMHFYRLDEEGRLIFTGANPAADRILNVDHRLLIGKTILEAFPDLKRTEVPQRLRKIALSGGVWNKDQIQYQDHQITGVYQVSAYQIGPHRVASTFLDISQRVKTEAEVRERLKFEMLVNELSARFINLPPGEVDRAIEEGLANIAKSVGLERCVIAQFTSDQKHLIYTHTYSSEGPPMVKGMDIAEVAPWFYKKVLLQQPILVTNVSRDFPEDAQFERQTAEKNQIKSVIALPIVVDGKTFGTFSAASRHAERTWPPELVARLRLVGEIFASALVRKRSEEALRQSEERYRQLFEINQAIKLIIDPESGDLIDANQAAARFYGYSLEKLKTMRIQNINTMPEPELRTALHQAVAGQRRHFIAHHRLASGEVRDVEIYTGPVAMPDRPVLYSIIFDVTERLRAEAERERLLAQVHEIMNSVPEGVALLDWSGRVLTANPAAEAYLDVLADVKIGHAITSLGDRLLSDLFTPPAIGIWHEMISGDRVFQVTARRVAGKSAPEHWVLVLRDATHEHQVQQQIQQQERLAAVGQMAAGIAHDFNNILSVILLYTEIALSAPDLSLAQRERMLTIKQQADRASNLIQQVLDFSRRAVLERRPMDLLPFVKEQAKLFERTLPENIRIRLGFRPGEYMVKADPTRLQQALLNLAVNARDAMLKGGELYIALSAVAPGETVHCITCGQVLTDNWLCLTVSDTGSGIPPNVLPHIFEPFFTTKAPGQGTGLGLAQVYGIVKQHEGHLDVQSHPGTGSVFRLFLPAYLSPGFRSSTPGADTLVLGKGQTILLVEDEAETRQALQEGLTLLNYQVMPVTDGVAALSYLAHNPNGVALVISDVVMPKMGGVALLHAMRRADLHMPVVLISGHPLTGEVEKLNQDGLFWFLAKPTSLKQLAQVLAQALLSHSG